MSESKRHPDLGDPEEEFLAQERLRQAQYEQEKYQEKRDSKNNLEMAEKVNSLLEDNEKIVLAESCTGGELCSTFAKIPGISESLCGSFVTYRAASKTGWLNVDPRVIAQHTTESIECAREMSTKALKNTPEASWGIGCCWTSRAERSQR